MEDKLIIICRPLCWVSGSYLPLFWSGRLYLKSHTLPSTVLPPPLLPLLPGSQPAQSTPMSTAPFRIHVYFKELRSTGYKATNVLPQQSQNLSLSTYCVLGRNQKPARHHLYPWKGSTVEQERQTPEIAVPRKCWPQKGVWHFVGIGWQMTGDSWKEREKGQLFPERRVGLVGQSEGWHRSERYKQPVP